MSSRLRSLAQAAREQGARQVEVLHRRSHTREVWAGGPGLSTRQRVEEGTAVRSGDGEGAFVTGSGTPSARDLPLDVLTPAGTSRAGRAPAWDWTEDGEAPAAGAPDDGAGPGGGEPGGDATPLPADLAASLFDGHAVRLSERELQRHLQGLAAPVLGAGGQARLSVAVIDTEVLPPAGEVRARRTTLVSLAVRFPAAGGETHLEMAARRLADLDGESVAAAVAAGEAARGAPLRVRVGPDCGNRAPLRLMPQVTAALMFAAARRRVAAGAPEGWPDGVKLLDDPVRPSAPGSLTFDAGGGVPARQVLMPGSAPLALTRVRGSYREPPRRLPTNLILEGIIPRTVPAADDGVHLLDVAGAGPSGLLCRGVAVEGDNRRPILALLELDLAALCAGDGLTAGVPVFVAGDGYAAAPPLSLSGAPVEMS